MIASGGVLVLALVLSLASAWKDRQELVKVTAANDFLRKSLGEMAVAITAREKEIDRLQAAGCPPSAPAGPRKGVRIQ